MKSTDAGYSQLTIPQPFASASGAALTPISNTSSVETPSFPDGFPAVFSSPSSDANAKFILRGMMNAIGNLASKNEWYRQAGGIYTFNSAWATANGGYPNGAILDYIENGHYYKVMSLKDDNMVDFTDIGVDGINWMYLNIDTTIDYSKLTVCNVPDFEWPYKDAVTTGISYQYSDVFPIGIFTAPRDGTLTAVGYCKFSVTSLTSDIQNYTGTGFAIAVCGSDTNPIETQSALIYARGNFNVPFVNPISYSYDGQKPYDIEAGTEYQIFIINRGATITESDLKVVLI